MLNNLIFLIRKKCQYYTVIYIMAQFPIILHCFHGILPIQCLKSHLLDYIIYNYILQQTKDFNTIQFTYFFVQITGLIKNKQKKTAVRNVIQTFSQQPFLLISPICSLIFILTKLYYLTELPARQANTSIGSTIIYS